VAGAGRDIARLSTEERWLALEGASELARASLEIRFRRFSRLVKVVESAQPASGGDEMETGAIDDAIRIGQIVDRVGDRLPWRPSCLRRSLAVWRMLSRRGIPSEIHLGVRDPETLEAHSWVTVGEEPVVGGGGVERFVRLASFG
jgi:hypothetical protein